MTKKNMHAVGYRANRPIGDPSSLIDVEVPVPEPGPHDLLVRIEAVSVNPADVKIRADVDPGGELKILGYDAAGVVEAVGSDVSLFAVGDEVYYAGSIGRAGTNAELHLVDERIVGRKPASLGFDEAAAIPLTAITAWETLFDRFKIGKDDTGTLLALGAAGGVGSLMVQLAAKLTNLTIIGTASRPESKQWVKELGAHHVVDHHDLARNVLAVAGGGVDYLFSPFSSGNVEAFAEVLRPGGQITAIDDPKALDLLPLKQKSISWHWEFMFTRPLFSPADTAQHDLLNEVARLIDGGTVRTTISTRLHPLDAATLREAHRLVETGSTIGKVVVSAS